MTTTWHGLAHPLTAPSVLRPMVEPGRRCMPSRLQQGAFGPAAVPRSQPTHAPPRG